MTLEEATMRVRERGVKQGLRERDVGGFQVLEKDRPSPKFSRGSTALLTP